MDKQSKMAALEKMFDAARASGKAHNKQEFAELIGTSRTSLSSAMNGDERYLTDSLLDRARQALEDIPPVQDEGCQVPVIPTEAMAGTLGEFAQQIRGYDCERMISPIKGADYAISVCGDSMTPEIPNGSQILIKKIWEDEFVEWGKVFCLDTRNGAIIKKVFPTDDPQMVECRSVNPDFPPFRINVKNILGWYRVLMVLSLK